jgi:hypothetical protein
MSKSQVRSGRREESSFAAGATLFAMTLLFAHAYIADSNEARFQEELLQRPIVYSPKSEWQAEATFRHQMDQLYRGAVSRQTSSL